MRIAKILGQERVRAILGSLTTLLLVTGLMATISGCSFNKSKAPTWGKQQPRLSSQLNAARDLVSVNSMLIYPVSFNQAERDKMEFGAQIDKTLTGTAAAELGLKIVPEDKWRVFYRENRLETPVSDAISVASKAGADAVLVTRILRYQERVGNRYAASSGASVGFAMELVRVSDRKKVWEASYHFQDEALSENLLTLKNRLDDAKGGEWRSAQDIISEGFRAGCKDLAAKRMRQFEGRAGA